VLCNNSNWSDCFSNKESILKKHILEVDGIQKRFNEKVLLSDVYLKCELQILLVYWGEMVLENRLS